MDARARRHAVVVGTCGVAVCYSASSQTVSQRSWSAPQVAAPKRLPKMAAPATACRLGPRFFPTRALPAVLKRFPGLVLRRVVATLAFLVGRRRRFKTNRTAISFTSAAASNHDKRKLREVSICATATLGDAGCKISASSDPCGPCSEQPPQS